ncbi:SSU72 protein-related protein [Trichomonas vaginalis G3]|uniref:RNA polymerase II subunit A C-terminal domain phosphatase SSU72 n=1 Tax=Trichomonas vaginalis (strain ATCC PRA-98 / G3) TaxID=412133 RepID=A2FVC5_TRIV3|nr:RNA polymerase II subunit A C-terminal domain phosphatase family [Trichomonas vaginalis G3]EAX91145.1 SSU72 protein-related protein [Trichomonas vaginalis G3]KAI5483901.1 RNA polymerase II subunit A C-terminal domain phosphatase family [Trichomonas vaginalis G3]|eukprot:XP_001304075.1 SSU72 protein-related protein [Trichomonas vaginalis G3]
MTSNNQLAFACVCASNVNRSMEGHRVLKEAGFNVSSYGTNDYVKMPGASNVPLQFDFGATYKEILSKMESENNQYYEEQGLIKMLRDDANTKEKPERWSSTFNPATLKYFDVIFTYDNNVMDRVLNEFRENGNRTFQISHVVNIQTPDSRDNAILSRQYTLRLAQMLSAATDLTENLESIVDQFNMENGNPKDSFVASFHIVSY